MQYSAKALLFLGLSLGSATYASQQTTGELLGYPSQSTDKARAQIIKSQMGATNAQTVEQVIDQVKQNVNPSAPNMVECVNTVWKGLRGRSDALRQELTRALQILQSQNENVTPSLSSQIHDIQTRIDALPSPFAAKDLFSIVSDVSQQVGGLPNQDLVTRVSVVKLMLQGDPKGDILSSLRSVEGIVDPNPNTRFDLAGIATKNMIVKLNRALENLGGTGAGVIGRISQLKSLLNPTSPDNFYTILSNIMAQVGGVSPDLAMRLRTIMVVVNGLDGTSMYESINSIAKNIGLSSTDNLQDVVPDLTTRMSEITGVQGSLISIVNQFASALNQRIGVQGSTTQDKLNIVFSGLQGQGNTGGDLQSIVNEINASLDPDSTPGTYSMIQKAQEQLRPFSSGLGTVLTKIITVLQSILNRNGNGLTLLELLQSTQGGIFGMVGGASFDGVSNSLYENLQSLRTRMDPTANVSIADVVNNQYFPLVGGNAYSSTNGVYQNMLQVAGLLKGQQKSGSLASITDFIMGDLKGVMGGPNLSTTTSPMVGVYDIVKDIQKRLAGTNTSLSASTIIDSLVTLQKMLWNNLSGSYASAGNIYADLFSLNRMFEYANGGKSLAEIFVNDIAPMLKSSFTPNEGAFEVIKVIRDNLNPQTALSLHALTGDASNANSIPYLIGGGSGQVSVNDRLSQVQAYLRNGSTSSIQAIILNDLSKVVGGNKLNTTTNSLFDNLSNIATSLKSYPFTGNSQDITSLVTQATEMLTNGDGIPGINPTSLNLNAAVNSVQAVMGYGSTTPLYQGITGSVLKESVLADLNLNSTNDVKSAVARLRQQIGAYTESSLQNMLTNSTAMGGVLGHLEGSGPGGIASASIRAGIENIRNFLGYSNVSPNLLANVTNKSSGSGLVGDLVGSNNVGNNVQGMIQSIVGSLTKNGAYNSKNVYDLITRTSLTGGVMGDLVSGSQKILSPTAVCEAIAGIRGLLDDSSTGKSQSIGRIVERMSNRVGGAGSMDSALNALQIRLESNSKNLTAIVEDLSGRLTPAGSGSVSQQVSSVLTLLTAPGTSKTVSELVKTSQASLTSNPSNLENDIKIIKDLVGTVAGVSSEDVLSQMKGLANAIEKFTSKPLAQAVSDLDQNLGTGGNLSSLNNAGTFFYTGGFTNATTLMGALGKETDSTAGSTPAYTVMAYVNDINTALSTLQQDPNNFQIKMVLEKYKPAALTIPDVLKGLQDAISAAKPSVDDSSIPTSLTNIDKVFAGLVKDPNAKTVNIDLSGYAPASSSATDVMKALETILSAAKAVAPVPAK